MNLTLHNMRDGYVELVREILLYGRPTAPRGQGTLEVLNATFTLLDPTDALPTGVGREPNVAIGAGEAIQLIGGFSDPEMMVSIAGSFERFFNGGILAGAYGPRIRVALPQIVQRLRDDPDSRQAVAEISQQEDFYGTPLRDIPCTKDLHFFIREGKLELVASMRSNDIWLGTAYDVFQFTQLQLSVARVLGLQAGPYHHHADSLHIYDRNLEAAGKLHAWSGKAGDAEGEIPPLGIGLVGLTVEGMQERAVRLWEGVQRRQNLTPSELWYANQLEGHRRFERT